MTMISDFLSKCTGFEWDKHNSEKIQTKHGVTPVECEQVFFNLPVIAGDDEKHSEIENRFYVLGQTDSGRLLFLVFTVRNDKVRCPCKKLSSIKPPFPGILRDESIGGGYPEQLNRENDKNAT